MLLTLDGKRLDEVIILIHVERFVDVAEGVHLWTEERGAGPPLLLVMGANASARSWPEALVDRRVEHWRLLGGTVLPFDAAFFRAQEAADIAHSGTAAYPTAHAHAEPSGLDRGAELADVTVPTLVIEAPEDPVNPPPNARHLATRVAGTLVTIPGMGHALPPAVLEPLANTILAHTH